MHRCGFVFPTARARCKTRWGRSARSRCVTSSAALPAGFDDLLDRRGSLSYELRGWEVIPTFDVRGETYDAARRPVSEFSRAISRLNPDHSTVTMWIYPDGFALYRRLRDDLHARGFTVAARPLPDNMTIRGSPSGSLSAGQ